MASERKPRRKRRGQVHGGWAASKSEPLRQPTTPQAKEAHQTFNQGVTSRERKHQAKTERLESGVHELDATPLTQPSWPTARIELIENFVSNDIDWLDLLTTGISWDQPTISIKQQMILQPRLSAWYGDVAYSYSGLSLQPAAFPPAVAQLADLLLARTGIRFNTVLANLYRSGKDSVAWHADDEPVLGQHPTIASLSFGATRRFQLTPKLAGGVEQPICTCARSVECTCLAQPAYECHLANGSLLLMTGAVQDAWLHQVPKEYHDRGPRVNLTFRCIPGSHQ
eukprot:m.61865 g.61865  ORF g.61865 m.61865 type:complete len:283 (-) comp13905_c0_seq1:349-1197(-)